MKKSKDVSPPDNTSINNSNLCLSNPPNLSSEGSLSTEQNYTVNGVSRQQKFNLGD